MRLGRWEGGGAGRGGLQAVHLQGGGEFPLPASQQVLQVGRLPVVGAEGRAGGAVHVRRGGSPGEGGAHERRLEALPEARVHPAVDDGVEARVAHGQPVRAEPQRRQPPPLAQPCVAVPRDLQHTRVERVAYHALHRR